MMALMVNCGLRASEVLNLELCHLDLNAGILTVRNGKGGKDRQLWVNQDTLELVKRWLKARPVQSKLVFTTLEGGPVHDRALRAMVKRRALKAGIAKDVHPHTLRHSFATEMYRKNKDLLTVQKCLGHSDISTTTIYTHLVNGEVEAAMREFCLG
jgi:integrase/recombinase XerD